MYVHWLCTSAIIDTVEFIDDLLSPYTRKLKAPIRRGVLVTDTTRIINTMETTSNTLLTLDISQLFGRLPFPAE